MSIRLLHRLALQALPTTIVGAEEVDKARILIMAGHVKASFPALAPGATPTAVVTEITRLGRSVVRRFPLQAGDA